MSKRQTDHQTKEKDKYMISWLDRITASILLVFAGAMLQTTAFAATLDDISYTSLPGDQVKLEMQLSEPLDEEPLNFTIDNPARIVLDFPDTSLNFTEKNLAIGIGAAQSVSSVEAAGRTRVVLNLSNPVAYEMEVQGDKVVLTLLPESGKGMGSAPSSSVAASVSSRPGMGKQFDASISNIDFRRGASGEGRIMVTLSDPSVAVNLDKEAGNVVVDFQGASLPEALNRRLDVIDFATPVREIDTIPTTNGANMVITTTTPNYDYLAYQTDNLLTIEFKPLTRAEQEEKKKTEFGYTGERLSLNFQDIEVRAVLQLIADFTGLNMVASDTVTGNVTLRLKNVPWDQALDIILKAKGLGMRKEGNVISVAPIGEIAAREKLELEASRQKEELAPLETDFVQVNYAKAQELAALIKAEENNLLSSRGSVTIDERTNTLIIQDVPDSLAAIRDMVAKLDIPVRQVLIESRIVNADESFAKDLGVRFGYSKATRRDSFAPETGVPGASNQPGGFVGGGIEGITDFGAGTSFVTGDEENLMVSLPVSNPFGALSLAYGVIGSYLLQLELSAALAEGRGEDIASPKVITANQREAVIKSGVEIPYQEATSSGATSVSFKEAVLQLSVTPQITPDDRVMLDLTVNQDTRGSPDVLGVPPINTREVSTQVLVDNGETVVLGGVYEQTSDYTSDRVPFFGDLPYIGFLFKRTIEDRTKSELLIFVTPKILKENLRI
ncbi:MAG TPA: type IV pilus secretin PilQ [Gammaproteobacteria bacterium]